MVPEQTKTSSAHKNKTTWKERWVISTDYKASQNETHHNCPSFITGNKTQHFTILLVFGKDTEDNKVSPRIWQSTGKDKLGVWD